MKTETLAPSAPSCGQTHTPGPWRIEGGRADGLISAKAGQPIAKMYYRHGAENGLANARLIAAAPELLAALEMVHAIVKNSPRQKAELFNDEGWNLICAAIARAGGRTEP